MSDREVVPSWGVRSAGLDATEGNAGYMNIRRRKQTSEREFDVLQVITSSVRRGAERFAVALEPELKQRGLRVRTVALVDGGPGGFDVDVLGDTRLGLSTLRALRSEAGRASVVIAHGSSTLPAAAMALAGLGVPFIYRNIGDPYYWGSSMARRVRSGAFLSRAEGVVALTSTTAGRITDHYWVDAERIHVIPRGIPEEQFPRRSPEDRAQARRDFGFHQNERVAVCVGALSPEKNNTLAIDAMALLPDRWHLLIAGDGPDEALVRAAAEERGDGRVQTLGAIERPAELMTAADVLLLPSDTEGLPGVVIEAGLIGVPAVSTDVGFIRDIVADGVSGHLVPLGDAEAMAAAVLAAEPNLDELGAEAFERCQRGFSMRSAAERWFDVLQATADLPQAEPTSS